MKIDSVTKRWIRNESDERAARAGCRFDERRGQHVIDFAEENLRLYEGTNDPLIPRDWQIEVTMRIFGWTVMSERWGRRVRRFTRASIWIPKKNKKTPTLGWWSLYLLCADGEPGQKVFLAAKDGKQSRELACKHALEMCKASETLISECKINEQASSILHIPTRSILMPLSSSNCRTQESKEGINGCVMIDETHVVDRAFFKRISRAGISRSEPLLIQVSTAGNNPESHGKEERDYGADVASGKVENQSYFYQEYSAPQDLTDEELAKDPIKWGKLANPAWGHTCGGEEYLTDYETSKKSISDLADFKMYRLNIWQQSENPWLNMGDWRACQEEFDADELEGADCYAGLDLAKTRDTSALTLIFPTETREDGHTHYRQLAFYWLPEARARAVADKVHYLQWARDKFITLTPGNTVHFRQLFRDIVAIFKRFSVLKVAFDSTYAQQLIEWLTEEEQLPEDLFAEYAQTMRNFAGATAAYERLIIDHRLHHNNNPVLSWQAGNVCVMRDNNENMRPVKQKSGDVRTIDGIVAGIMALQLALDDDNGRSVYETRGMLEF